MVVTEIVELTDSPTCHRSIEEREEDEWTMVVGSAHHRRKARGMAKKYEDASRRSDRIAGLDPEIFEDMTTKAVKRAELRDTLRSCSIGLQNQIMKCQVLKKKTAPLGLKTVSEIRAAAFARVAGGGEKGEAGKNKMVPVGADD